MGRADLIDRNGYCLEARVKRGCRKEKRGQSGNGKARTTSARDKMKRRKLRGMHVGGEANKVNDA